MMTTPNWSGKSTEEYLTTPLTTSLKGLEETQKKINIQNQDLNSIGMRGSTYGGISNSPLSSRYYTPWVDTAFSQTPVELYDTATGKSIKKYNNIVDYQMDTMVVSGGAESKPSLGFSGTAIPIGTATGIRAVQAMGLAPGTPLTPFLGVVGGLVGFGEGLTNVATGLNEAYEAFDEDTNRTISLLAEEAEDKDGNKIYKVNMGKAAYGNALSGPLTRSYQTAPTDTPVSWDEAGTGLNINVAPAFANSDTYQDYIADVAASLKGLTKATDTDGQYVSQLNTAIKALQSRYFFDQQQAKALQAKFPNASEDAIAVAIDNELTGYATTEEGLEAPLYVFNDAGELTPKTAAEVFNTLYDMGDDKVAKDKYMGQLFGYLDDPKVSDDDRAVIQGQINAIYVANSNDKLKYKGMIEKSYADKIGENALLIGQSPNDVAEIASGGEAYGELKYFTESEVTNTLAGLTSAAVNIWSTAQTMKLIEGANRKVLTGIGSTLGKAAASGSRLEKVSQWLMSNAGNEAAFANITVNSYRDLAAKAAGAAFDFGIQGVSDLEYDLAKLGLSKLAGNDMDFWKEFSDDLALDMFFTLGHSGALTDALSKSGLADYSIADLGRVIRDNGKVTIDTDTNTKVLNFSIGDRGDYKVTLSGEELSKDAPSSDVKDLTVEELNTALSKAFFAVNYESQQRAAQTLVKLADKHPTLYKGYEAVIDKNIGLKMLGYRKLAETGDYTNLLKLSNAANSNLAVGRAYNRFANSVGAEGMQALNKASADFAAATGRTELSAKDSAYINASQALMRAGQDFKANRISEDEYQNAKDLYQPSISAVTGTDKVALDQLMQGLAAYAKAIGGFEVSERLQTTNFYENIQKYNGYIPLFAKRDGDGRPVEYRQAHRETGDSEVRLHPSAMENPVKAVEQYADAVIRNAARAEQARTVLEAVSQLPGVKVSEDSTLRQDYEDLPAEKLVEKYDIPKEVRASYHKLADTETKYHQQLDSIMQKSLLAKHVEDYHKAQATLATSTADAKYQTVEGDPFLSKNVGVYKKGMTQAEIKSTFLDNVRESIESIMTAANRRNYKFRKYITRENPKASVETIMATIAPKIDGMTDGELIGLVTQKLGDATPMVTYDQLLYHWIDNDSLKRHDELLNDPEILSGEAAYDTKGGRKVKKADAAIRVMTDGRIDTIYLSGATKADQEMAKGMAEVLNAPIQQPSKMALVRFMTHIAHQTAQLKRFNVSGGLPSRAPVNLARDVQQAYRQVGVSATLQTSKLVGSLVDPSQFSKEDLSKLYSDLDRIGKEVERYTEAEVGKLYRQGALGAAARLAGKPQAPTFEQQLELRPAQRTLNQLKYQWDVLKYNMGNFGKGGATDILLTPGNLAEAATRKRVGQNAYIFEFRNRLQSGAGTDEAMAAAFERGAWAARNATTDFSTKGWLTEKMAQFTPFSYSSFSDLASKVESFVMDPIGMSRRTVLSMAAYAMNLCAVLSSEENRKRYMNMSEYQRLHSMMIDLGGGQLLTLPIDEAYAGLLAPLRLFIETLAYKEPVTFWKVVGSFLDMGPLDLSGFTEGDTFNITRGLETVVDSYAPALVTTGLELATGRDFYYGNNIAVDDRYLASFGLSADSQGDYVQNNKDSSILHGLSDLLNIPQWWLQHAFSFFTGTIGDYALHYLDKLQGATENEAYGKGIAQAFYKSFLPSESGGTTAFYDGIDALRQEKQKLMSKLNANWEEQLKTTGVARAELQSKRQKMLDDFALKVTDFISGYLSVYEQTGGLTKSEASSIYYLFDFTDDYQGGGFNVGTAGSQAYENVKSQAGIQASTLSSQVIGTNYDNRGLYKTSSGTWERESPNGVQAMNRLMYNRNQEYAAQINRLATDNNLSKGKSAASNQISAIYAKAEAEGRKPTNEEHAQMDAIRAKWDVEAALALAPFFQANGLDPINSSAVAQELGQYFLVIGDAEKDNKGRYISASNLNKQRGFVQSFVKSIYEKAGIK